MVLGVAMFVIMTASTVVLMRMPAMLMAVPIPGFVFMRVAMFMAARFVLMLVFVFMRVAMFVAARLMTVLVFVAVLVTATPALMSVIMLV
jgi:hypothetical protein